VVGSLRRGRSTGWFAKVLHCFRGNICCSLLRSVRNSFCEWPMGK
jgi:hypothetical protein